MSRTAVVRIPGRAAVFARVLALSYLICVLPFHSYCFVTSQHVFSLPLRVCFLSECIFNRGVLFGLSFSRAVFSVCNCLLAHLDLYNPMHANAAVSSVRSGAGACSLFSCPLLRSFARALSLKFSISVALSPPRQLFSVFVTHYVR